MEALRFPVWEKPFREAQSEIDLDKLVEKIHETEAAMFVGESLHRRVTAASS